MAVGLQGSFFMVHLDSNRRQRFIWMSSVHQEIQPDFSPFFALVQSSKIWMFPKQISGTSVNHFADINKMVTVSPVISTVRR